MQSKVHPTYKTKYRVANWPAYNQALVHRGDVTVWLSSEAIAAWTPGRSGQRGGQRRYSDLAIETALTLRLLYHLPLRQAEGFLHALFRMMRLDLSAPDYTTLSRCSQYLRRRLRLVLPGEGLHLVLDSTGLSIVGAGECTAAKHGESTQVTVVVHDLDGESEPATGERPEGMFRRGGRRIDRAAPPSAAAFEERLVGERVEGLSQLGRRGDDDLLQRDHRRGAGFDRRPARDLEVAHHLDRPVRGLRDGGRLASQDRPRGGLGIHGVGLPGDSTGAPVAPVHFEHLVPGSPDRARESRPVAAGALDAERGDTSVTLGVVARFEN